MLDLLPCVCEEMGDRAQSRCDIWPQRFATQPSVQAVRNLETDILLFIKRDFGRPKPEKTSHEWYRDVHSTKHRLKTFWMDSPQEKRTVAQIINKLFDEDSSAPCKLERFEVQIILDIGLYTRELEHYEQVFTSEVEKKLGISPRPARSSTTLIGGNDYCKTLDSEEHSSSDSK